MVSPFLQGTVTEVEPIAGRMRRVRLSGPRLRGLAWTPGAHVRLLVGDPLRPRSWAEGLLRSYSVWDYSPEGHLDVCVFDHPRPGPGARWARRVEAGDTAALLGPRGRLALREDAPYHLFAGDETACAAFGAMLRALPASAAVHGALAVCGPDCRLPLPRGDRLAWTYEPHGLLDAVRALELPDEPGVAYLAGEAYTCQVVRAHLVTERGWARQDVVVQPCWTPGKRGMR